MNSCDMKSNDNTTDILLMQIKREIKELADDHTAKMLRQDGKIADVCVYIKNNLSNYIRTLLDSMQHSGELDNIITTTILSEIEVLQNQVEDKVQDNEVGVMLPQYPYGDVRRYGAICDGDVDDTKAFHNCAENCRNFGFPFYAPVGEYKITEDIDLRYISRIDIQGKISGDYTVTIGDKSSNGNAGTMSFRELKKLRVEGLKGASVYVGFCDLLHLYANGADATIASTAYNQFYGSYCNHVKLESISNGDVLGWVNENVFRIKRIKEVTITGDYKANNNRFEHCNLEKGIITMDAATNNYFTARSEGGLTVNKTGEYDTNFIQREYYHKHYFGDDLMQYGNGAIGYYEVNKLQTERVLMLIDENTTSFPVGTLLFHENGTFTGNAFNGIFNSNLIPSDTIFALKMKADKKVMRVQLNFYDANKNRIFGSVDNFADGRMSFNASGDWSYTINSNVDTDSVVFWPGAAKYVEYRVIFGNVTEAMNYVQVKLVTMVGTDIPVSNSIRSGVYTQVPTAGYWKEGTILIGKNPRGGASLGIVCVESGTPGTWKNFGAITA